MRPRDTLRSPGNWVALDLIPWPRMAELFVSLLPCGVWKNANLILTLCILCSDFLSDLLRCLAIYIRIRVRIPRSIRPVFDFAVSVFGTLLQRIRGLNFGRAGSGKLKSETETAKKKKARNGRERVKVKYLSCHGHCKWTALIAALKRNGSCAAIRFPASPANCQLPTSPSQLPS